MLRSSGRHFLFEEEKKMGTTVFISHLPDTATRENIYKWVREECGLIIVRKRVTPLHHLDGHKKGLCRGLCYVRMDSEADAQAMVALSKTKRFPGKSKRCPKIVFSRTETESGIHRATAAPMPETFEEAMSDVVAYQK